MRSTIETELCKQDRDGLENQTIETMMVCSSRPGEGHDWRMMEWSQHTDSHPVWAAGHSAPVGHVAGLTLTTSKMICCCGTSVEVKVAGR